MKLLSVTQSERELFFHSPFIQFKPYAFNIFTLLHFIFQCLIWSILKRTVDNQQFYMKVLD